MSILSFPRIYFKGYIAWDPCTFNNNDFSIFPTYDPTQAALNWEFLATQGPKPGGITPANFATMFRPWAITLQEDTEEKPPGRRIPAEWNMFGTHDVNFVQYQDKQTVVTSGATAYGAPVSTDPLIGRPIAISNDSKARLVDTNPTSFWSSQIYWDKFMLGDGAPACSLTGERQFRMHSRWLNLNRIYSASRELTQPAASVAACFQTCIPTSKVNFSNGSRGNRTYSTLVAALQEAAGRSGTLGVMVRFTAYVNLYFQNGIFNDAAQRPRDYTELAAQLKVAWDAWSKDGDSSQFFSQPCYSHIVGSVGVWKDGEIASVPGGRFLAATQNSVAPITSLSDVQPKPAALGPVVADVDFAGQLISLDLNSAIPEVATPGTSASDLTKVNVGALTVGVQDAAGVFTPLAPPIPYEGYQRSAYEASAGIIDLRFDSNSAAAKSLKAGTALLAIQMQGQTTLAEQDGGYSAQTDSRGIYLDENEQTEFQVAVFRSGAPAPGAQVLVAKYDQNLSLIATSATQLVNFTNGVQQNLSLPSGSDKPTVTSVTVVTADGRGIATVGIAAQAPGFPVLAFYPFATGESLPTPPLALLGPGVPPDQMITNAFYATVRVLPFDSAVPGQFIALWNATHDPAQAWRFIYNRVLYVYDMLFSVMLEYLNLGDRTAVENSASGLPNLISKDMSKEDPGAMPVTRDMSEGKRTALLLWCYLVQQNYKVDHLDLGVLNPAKTSTSV